ncbi:MAG TPA: DUF2142 domain-containing protein [Chthoniobacterales bacterium]|nr:DUF2142 domain-containing protein [Chthoniobacterales bacterium]
MKTLSKRELRWIIASLCALAAIRVFVFAAAFPFFNNVDEQAHVDLVVKYAHGTPPHGIVTFSPEAALYFAVYSSPEYFVPPDQYGGQYPPPNWLLPRDQVEKVLQNEVPFWESRSNHESGEPPLYYAIGGAWFDFGRTLGLRGLVLLYWVRFLNIAFAAALVWVGYKAALIVFGDRSFPAITTATLLAIWPQSSFYSVQGDSLSTVTFGLAFIAVARLLESERPAVWLGVSTGLAVAATCLIKTANLPLLLVVFAAVIYKAAILVRARAMQRAISILTAFLISVFVPLALWAVWNQQHFGDLTATNSKIELLGWTPKAFADWWSHPIFTPAGAKNFWVELIASFWRGEFIWHHERMAGWWSDAFYWSASTIVLVIVLVGLFIRRKSESNQAVLWIAVFSFASLVGFLVLLSIRFDFGECPYPSRENPFFTSGRLLNAAAVPFFVLFAYAIEQLASWTKREWIRWGLLVLTIILVTTWQLSINSSAFSSGYNFFHHSAPQ